MKRFSIYISCIISICFFTFPATADPATGPLRVCKDNPRYFTDGGGKAILLTGSHVWNNLVDMGPSDPPPAFDYEQYITWMEELNHNFFRLWAWELASWNTQANKENKMHFVEPHPWSRTGPGNALDGKPKFDLTKFNPVYFERLRERVQYAGDRGIYVSIMLFEGWGMQFIDGALKTHPFHKDNNVNGIDGDRDGDGNGLEIHELSIPTITNIQESYIKHVVDTVNDLDNVLYEISNENHPDSTEWQYHTIDLIHDYEKSKPKQHPVGMTFQYKGGKNQTLFDSPADWISPNADGGYRDNPPANDGEKVIVSDTDHQWGIGGNQAWVWKSFCRGLNPIFMDPYDGVVLGKKFDPQWDPVRQSMGIVRRLAQRMDITSMKPHNDLASSGYCLAEPGGKYIIYIPEKNEVTVDLSNAKGTYSVRWMNPSTRERKHGESIEGGTKIQLKSPFDAGSALTIRK